MSTQIDKKRGGWTAPLLAAIRRKWPWLHGDTLTAVLMLLPSMLAVAVFIYGFIIWTGYISLVKWDTVVEDYTFVGLKNWIALFKSERFHWNLRNVVLYAAAFMTQCIVIGFFIALILERNIKGEAVFRTIVVLPFAVSGIVTGVAWRWLMQPATGLNLIFRGLGFTDFNFAWNAHPRWGILSIAMAAAWQFTGYIMSLYLAALRGIPEELREAARVDGASNWQLYRHIIIPLMMPTTFTAIVLTGMNSIRAFDLVVVLAGPAHTTDMFAYHMHQSTFGLYRFSNGAAVGFFMIFLASFLVGPYLRSMSQEVES